MEYNLTNKEMCIVGILVKYGMLVCSDEENVKAVKELALPCSLEMKEFIDNDGR